MQVLSLSPQKRTVAAKEGHCNKCNKQKVTKDFMTFDSAWIGCAGPNCDKWVSDGLRINIQNNDP